MICATFIIPKVIYKKYLMLQNPPPCIVDHDKCFSISATNKITVDGNTSVSISSSRKTLVRRLPSLAVFIKLLDIGQVVIVAPTKCVQGSRYNKQVEIDPWFLHLRAKVNSPLFQINDLSRLQIRTTIVSTSHDKLLLKNSTTWLFPPPHLQPEVSE